LQRIARLLKILELRFSASLSSAFLQRKKALDYLIDSDNILYVTYRKEKQVQDTITKKMFYLCDDKSENYFVARIYRSDDEIKDELKNLKVGEIHQISKTKHFVRWE